MIKKTALLSLFIVLIFHTKNFCQNNQKKGYIGLSAGFAVPVGEFTNDGLAKGGFKFNLIDFGYRFGEHFGIAASWFGAAHISDLQSIDSKYFSGNDPIWSYGSVMGGPMVAFPFNDKLELNVKVLIGLVSSKYSSDDFGDLDGSGLGVDIGGSFLFKFADRWCVIANLDYVNSKQDFDPGELKITAINITGGIGYRL